MTRIKWLDITKGIAILLTIIGHTVSGTIRELIFSFHMPLFLILAGYNFRPHRAISRRTLAKDANRLLLPVLLTCLLRLVFSTIQVPDRFPTLLQTGLYSILWGNGCSYGGLPGIGAIWFLIDLFYARQLYRIIFEKIPRFRPLFLCYLAFFGIFIGKRFWLPQNLDLILVSLVFLETGYQFRQLEGKRPALLSALGCFCFVFWVQLVWHERIYIEMAVRHYPAGVFCILAAIAGSICVMQFSQAIEGLSLLSRPLEFLGRHSLLLLCIHDLDSQFPSLWNFPRLEIPYVTRLLSLSARLFWDILALWICLAGWNFLKRVHRNKSCNSTFP